MEQLNKKQKAILIGSLLGDGYLHKNRYGSVSLEIKQEKRHYDYVEWLWQALENLCNHRPQQRKDNLQWRLLTRYSKTLLPLYDLFYYHKKKVIASDIRKYLKDPISLAVWYMDDGSLDWRIHNHFAYYLATNCFSLKGQRYLQETLKKNFGVKSSIHKTTIRGNLQYKLYIGKQGRKKFQELIQPYIVKCFYYKLPPKD
ncbi:hypothetical protein [Archaeoglobus sp.]